MNSAKREATIGFIGSDEKEFKGRSYHGKAIVKDEWIQVKKGVRFQVVEIEGVDPLLADGAKVEFEPGNWSPFQYNASKNTMFIDRPTEREQIMVTAHKKEGETKIFVDYFYPEIDGTAFEIEMGPGWLMATYAPRTNEGPAKRIEYEELGFYNPETKLIDVERGAKEVAGFIIPPEFWEIVNKVERGELISGATSPNNRT